MQHDNTSCAPGRLCHRWRVCPRCAGIRQAKAADLAERRAIAPAITWACLDFDRETKQSVLRSAALIGTGGIWTIEHGERAGGRGLHLNLLIDAADRVQVTAERLARAVPGRDVWAQTVPRADVRNVAAYIHKRRQAPDPDRYDGRISGTWGHWRGAAEILATDREAGPIVQAVAIQTGLERAGVLPQDAARRAAAFVPFYNGQQPKAPELSREEYRAIAEKNLSGILSILGRKRL